jgi:endonuclease/exonuclease/phosphatase family metal-dependent hydrolase
VGIVARETVRPPAGPVPAAVTKDLNRLGAALDEHLPAKVDDNLLIGTWNIRGFGGLTPKWQSGPNDQPKRDWHALACLAAVVERFDVTAIQESKRDTTALMALLHRLGDRYRVIVSDATEGAPGNAERLAYVYDSERVQPSGLVGEIVLPAAADHEVEQFARTPYAAAFVRGGTDFILTTVHVLWGKGPQDRLGEVQAFADWMRKWADRPKDWNHNLLVLGDFNLDRIDDPLYAAFVSTGLWPPPDLGLVPRTIFDNDKDHHYYDQIAWFNDPTDPDLPPMLNGLTFTNRCGSLDFVPLVLNGLTKSQLSFRISDHYPLWVEFTV